MNDFTAQIFLAIIQGISEWFPVSSSGHLVLFSHFFNFENSVQFDVALHFGTLMAVFVYFGKDIVDIIEDIFKGKWNSKNSKLGFYLIVSSIPAAIAGFFLRKIISDSFNNLLITAIGFGITSMLLFISSINFSEKKKIGFYNSFIIGIGQALSLIPGISRSGSTISAGLILGLREKEAVKFSFLMAIPIIFGAGILEIGNNKIPSEYLWATLVSFFVGLASIHLLLKIISKSRKNLIWFALYALLLAFSITAFLIFVHKN